MATTKRARRQTRSAAKANERELARRTAELIDVQRVTLIAMAAVCVLGFLRGANDSFSTPKLTALLLGTVVLLAAGVVRLKRSRALLLPTSGALVVVGVFAGAIVLTAVANPHGMVSAIGPYTRYEGYVPYLCFVTVLLVMIRVSDDLWLASLGRWLAVVLAGVVGYGLLQVVGADPFSWTGSGGHYAFSTLGQENFSGAVVGCLIPVAVGCLIFARRSPVQRRLLGVLLAGSVVIVWRANSFQGPVAAIAGLVPLGVVIVGPRLFAAGRAVSVRLLTTLVGVAGIVALLLGPNLLRGTWSELRSGTNERRYLWDAAFTLFNDHPVLGDGFGSYARHFGEVRPAQHAFRFGPLYADSPHSVPLNLLVSGGIVLLLAYLALVVFTGWRLIVGLRQSEGDRRVLLAMFGGVWLAYQTQSLVSIDVPPVALLHWLSAGAVIALAAPADLRLVRLGKTDVARMRRQGTRAAEGAVVAVALVAAWFAIRPMRADLEAGAARDARARQDPEAQVRHARSASQLGSWEPTYLAQLAGALASSGDNAAAYAVGVRAARLDTGKPITALAAAGLAERLGRFSEAERWYREAIRRDPRWGGTYDAAGAFYGDIGNARKSVRLLRRATDLRPQVAAYWRNYGAALARVGRREEAIDALRFSLTLEPSNIATEQIAFLENMGDNSRP